MLFWSNIFNLLSSRNKDSNLKDVSNLSHKENVKNHNYLMGHFFKEVYMRNRLFYTSNLKMTNLINHLENIHKLIDKIGELHERANEDFHRKSYRRSVANRLVRKSLDFVFFREIYWDF